MKNRRLILTLIFQLCFFTLPFGESTLAIQSGHFSFPESSKFSQVNEPILVISHLCVSIFETIVYTGHTQVDTVHVDSKCR